MIAVFVNLLEAATAVSQGRHAQAQEFLLDLEDPDNVAALTTDWRIPE